MKGNDFAYWYRERKWEFTYEFSKAKTEGENVQDSLFNLHPSYNK